VSDARSAWLFPGQGEEGPGMASADVLRLTSVRRLLDCGSARVGVELREVVRGGGPGLARTELVQPALVALALGIAEALEARGEAPAALAGHSLGELSAFAVAGCLASEHAVELACARGALMGEAARRSPGGMIGVRVESAAQLAELLARGRSADEALDLAAHNAPGLWVLSGRHAALRAVEACSAVTRLPVVGPWHSRLMQQAELAWAEALREVPFAAPRRLLIANRTGLPVGAGDDPRALLAGQLTAPVQWEATMRALVAAGVERFVTLGPARMLRGLCRANLGGDARIVAAGSVLAATEARVA